MERLSDWLQHDIKGEDLVAIAALGVLAWQAVKPLITLPTEPVPTATLPIVSHFDRAVLEPFVLRSAPVVVPNGVGKVSFEAGELIFQNYLGWSFICTRVQRVNTIHAHWIWKELSHSFQIPEVWIAYPWRIGRTAMIKFVNGEAYQILIGHADKFLCKVDLKQWVDMTVDANYEAKTFDLSINSQVFSLEMLDESIGTADYVQIQLSLQGLGRLAIREISAS